MKNAINLIKRYEGLRLQAYRCPAGRWTIGWGHTGDVSPSMSITREEAESLLAADVAKISAQIDALGVSLSANRRAALISFIFNVGAEAFKGSTLRRRILEDVNHPDIPAQFARWVHAGGKVMPGLVRRRAEEAALWTGGGL